MVGAGIFALVGQVAGLAGGLVPAAFLAGAIIVAFSSYSYVKYSGANPSSGGIAMLLKDGFGPGIIAGSFSLPPQLSPDRRDASYPKGYETSRRRDAGDSGGTLVFAESLAVSEVLRTTSVFELGLVL